MSEMRIFDSETALPDDMLSVREHALLGFESRYERVCGHLRLLLNMDKLDEWNQQNHGGKLAICSAVAEQYALVIFQGDVGTGKTVMAECIANRLVIESKTEDSVLLKMSNRVRGSGRVGEMSTLLSQAFQKLKEMAGKNRRAILILDEADSLAAARSQAHSHHEDKVAVNTLIQEIDQIRKFAGRVVVILCTNRASVLDPAIQRRAAIVELFERPTANERRELFKFDLGALELANNELDFLVENTGPRIEQPGWTYSDIRTRLYPAALAQAFPNEPLRFDHLRDVVINMKPSPAVEES